MQDLHASVLPAGRKVGQTFCGFEGEVWRPRSGRQHFTFFELSEQAEEQVSGEAQAMEVSCRVRPLQD
jgi:hypothetical protein